MHINPFLIQLIWSKTNNAHLISMPPKGHAQIFFSDSQSIMNLSEYVYN